MSFCSLIKGITPKIRVLCFVLIHNEPFTCFGTHLLWVNFTTSMTWPPFPCLLWSSEFAPKSPTPSEPSAEFAESWSACMDCGGNVASKHARKHRARPPRAKKLIAFRFERLWFCLCWCWHCEHKYEKLILI